MDTLERKNDTLSDICKEIVGELNEMRNSPPPPVMFSPETMSFPKKNSEGMVSEHMGMSVPIIPENMNSAIIEELYKNIMVSDDMLEPEPLNLKVYEHEELEEVESCITENENESIDDEKITVEEVTLVDTTEQIQVTKIEETEPLEESPSVMTETYSTKHSKKSLQKMNLQMLRTMVIRDGLCTEPSKMKKQELIELVLSANEDDPVEESTE